VVVVGHSGGAAISANMLGRHPALLDAALVVSCPCDVEKWRQHMFQLTGQPVFQGTIDTLSPVEQITGMSGQANVTMMVGSQDKVAPPVSASAIKPWPHSSAKKSSWCNWRARSTTCSLIQPSSLSLHRCYNDHSSAAAPGAAVDGAGAPPLSLFSCGGD
jgi:hypothetical protein